MGIFHPALTTASKTPSTRRCCSNMEQFIGCDAHKKFSVFVAVNEKGQAGEALRVAHDRELYREFLARLPAHSAIALEASGSYSWLLLFSRMDAFRFTRNGACRTIDLLARRVGQRRDATRAPMQVRNGWRPQRRLLGQPATPSKDCRFFVQTMGSTSLFQKPVERSEEHTS